MSPAAPAHRIRRLVWRVAASSGDQAWDLRSRLRSDLGDALQATVAAVFEDLDRADRVVRLPRLELRLELDDPGQLVEVFGAALRRRLQELLVEGEGRAALAPRDAGSASRHRGGDATARSRSLAEDQAALLEGYLARGTLDPGALPVGQDLAATLAEAARARLASGGPAASPLTLSTPRQALRWLGLLDAADWPAAVGVVRRPASAEVGDEHLAGWARRLSSAPVRALLSRDLRLRWLAEALAGGVGAAARVRAAGLVLDEGGTALPARVEAALSGVDPSPRGDDVPADGAAHAGAQAGPLTERGGPTRLLSAVQPQLPDHDGRRAYERPLGQAVAAAGLVLLHPHLPRLLAACGLDPARWSDADADGMRDAALRRAQALLWYVATGSERAVEPELTVVRLLLGLDATHEPWPVQPGQLSAADRDEAQTLLAAVSGQWSVLRSTSARGLRETFLQRGGLLRAVDGGWQLQLEPSPFDVLLAHLPWGLGVVRLPWMARPLFVEWPTP